MSDIDQQMHDHEYCEHFFIHGQNKWWYDGLNGPLPFVEIWLRASRIPYEVDAEAHGLIVYRADYATHVEFNLDLDPTKAFQKAHEHVISVAAQELDLTATSAAGQLWDFQYSNEYMRETLRLAGCIRANPTAVMVDGKFYPRIKGNRVEMLFEIAKRAKALISECYARQTAGIPWAEVEAIQDVVEQLEEFNFENGNEQPWDVDERLVKDRIVRDRTPVC